MKAILVIDMSDDMKIEDIQALNVTLYNGLFVREVKMNRHLKPLPKKRDYSEELADTRGLDMYMEGWNACLKEIEDD